MSPFVALEEVIDKSEVLKLGDLRDMLDGCGSIFVALCSARETRRPKTPSDSQSIVHRLVHNSNFAGTPEMHHKLYRFAHARDAYGHGAPPAVDPNDLS